MNIFLSCATFSPWADVIKELDYDLKYVICWRDEFNDFKQSFPHAFTHTVEDAWEKKGYLKNAIPKIRVDMEGFSEYFDIYYRMYERIDPFSVHNYDIRKSRFELEIFNWISILTQNEIDLVISPSIPHRLFDFTLYLVCNYLKVNFLTFQMTPFGSYVLPIETINQIDCAHINNDEFIFKVIENKLNKNLGLYNDAEPEYMKKHKQNRKLKSMAMTSFKKLTRNLNKENVYKFKRPNSYHVPLWGENRELSWIEFLIYNVSKFKKLNKLKAFYKSISVKAQDLKQNAYVLVALHYQPEETSCPSGFKYADQIRLIKKLRYLLGDDVYLYVKEHGAQFDLHQEGNISRSKTYYNDILALENTFLIDTEDDTFDLIDNSMFVVTLTGTIGWEAAIRKKPVMHLGRAWYEGMPYTYKPNNDGEMIDYITSHYQDKFTNEDVEQWHKNFSCKLLPAKHYKFTLNNTDLSSEKSVSNLTNFIKNKYEKLS